jgi:coproporphyrinogen III oxidase-like Fe-S oxidoreductase
MTKLYVEKSKEWLRSQMTQRLFDEKKVALKGGTFALAPHLQAIESLGLYLHIPFCRQICPYCPYNKELFHAAVAERYTDAVLQEIDRYGEIVGNRPFTSFYIGGGTPTTMLDTGLPRILEHIDHTFNMQCGIHMESHLNDLSDDNLDTIVALGVEYLSMGIEALQDRHLRTLCRPYTAAEAQAAIVRAVAKGFQCVLAEAAHVASAGAGLLRGRLRANLGVGFYQRRGSQVLLCHCPALSGAGRQRRLLSP